MEFVQELIKGLDDAIVMRQISRVVGPIIGTGLSGLYPYRATEADDATWVSENAESVETSLTYSAKEFKAKPL